MPSHGKPPKPKPPKPPKASEPIRVDVHVYQTPDPALAAALARIETAITRTTKELKHMSGELDDLTAAVDANTDVEDGAITLLGQLSDLIRQNANDPAALTALADKVNSERAKLAAALVANTPSA